NRYRARDGDFFFLPARTVHALGAGCLLYEVQQTCDVTFRVDDWGRVGLDGKPRPLHIAQSLATIDFAATGTWPAATRETVHRDGGSVRRLGECAYFAVEERRAGVTRGGGGDACSIVVCLDGHGTLATAGGSVALAPMRTVLVPAIAGTWTASAAHLESLRLLVATPGSGSPEVRKSGSPEVS
ncbi:MAG: hypothetical protein H0X38_11895, partial [Planctomycetes bacterium]|nr:hypothetical protein [Planctomycetota bacterium]